MIINQIGLQDVEILCMGRIFFSHNKLRMVQVDTTLLAEQFPCEKQRVTPVTISLKDSYLKE